MIFSESVCFEISANGKNSDVKKFVNYLKSGELDEFFEITSDLFSFDDDYETASPEDQTSVLFASDEFGIEIDEFDSDEFLEVICKAAKALHLSGTFYNFDDEEYRFVSEAGDAYYMNADGISLFNDELDAERSREERESDNED